MYLTQRQREVFDFIDKFIRDHGYSPSFAEIAAGLGLRSVATVHKHLVALERKGLLSRERHRSRAVEIRNPAPGRRPQTEATEVPLLGRIAAGQPIDDLEPSEAVSVPADMLTGGETYALKVRGDTMADEGIYDGDTILVERRDTPLEGELVVAQVGQTGATLKRYYHEADGGVRLQPSNPATEPIRVAATDCRVRGVVVGLLRRYH